MASGSVLKRSRCCEGRNPDGEDLHIPQLLCPVCPIWPVVRDRVVVGWLIFPSSHVTSGHLGGRGARLHCLTAEKLCTHSFRRGAARELMSAGGTYAELLRAGQWRGNAARFYLGLGENELRALTDIPIEGSDDEPS